MLNYLFMLAANAPNGETAGNPFLMIGFMVVFIVFFYFVVIRPQNKQKKEMQKMLSNLKKGDKIVTIGGIIGRIAAVGDNQITIRVNDSNTEITFEKGAISKVIEQKNEKKSDKPEQKSEDASNTTETKNDANETTKL